MPTLRLQVGYWNVELTDEAEAYYGYGGTVDPRQLRQLEQQHGASGPYFRLVISGGRGGYAQVNEIPMEMLLALADAIYRKAQRVPLIVPRPTFETLPEPSTTTKQPPASDDSYTHGSPDDIERIRKKMEGD